MLLLDDAVFGVVDGFLCCSSLLTQPDAFALSSFPLCQRQTRTLTSPRWKHRMITSLVLSPLFIDAPGLRYGGWLRWDSWAPRLRCTPCWR
jgi:hypothetical protein